MAKSQPPIVRNPTYDFIRVFAVILVVLVHTHTIPSATTFTDQYWPLFIFFYLAKLGVPLFVMLSGILLLEKKEAATEFYKKRINKIIFPWITWAIILLFIKIATNTYTDISFTSAIKHFIIILITNYWYMPMIVLLYGITPYLRVMIQSKLSLQYLVLGWFVVVSLCPLLYQGPLFPGTYESGIVALTISFAGYFILSTYLKIAEYQKVNISNLVLLLLGGVLSYLLLAHYSQPNQKALFFILHDYFSPSIVVGSAALFTLLTKLGPSIIKRIKVEWLATLSSLTYGIFLSHIVVLYVLERAFPNLFYISSSTIPILFLCWLIKGLLVYSISTVLILAGTKLPFLQRYVH